MPTACSICACSIPPAPFFELVGVINRLDRRPFQDGACGETRLVYRLAYRADTARSRLPMTVSVELRGDPHDADGSCRKAAALWLRPAAVEGPALGRWLVSAEGPLSPERLSRSRLVQIAVNLQSVRWPSTVKPDLGGHAEYLLHAYRWQPSIGRYLQGELENTPDVARLRRDPALRAELLDWLQRADSRAALDVGALRMPDRFLALEAVSVAPLGSARLANQPFSQLFNAAAFPALPQSRTQKSSRATLRRLDDLTCNGCHQSRSIAGFHLLGADQAGTTRTYDAGNALAVPGSPHLQDELARRAQHAEASLAQLEPDPFRPLAERGRTEGAFGGSCGLGDDPGAADWRCGAGLFCQPHGSAEGGIGVCMPKTPEIGSLCEPVTLRASVDPRKDAAAPLPGLPCGASAHCERTRVGFPGGMCSGGCNPNEPNAVCGRIALLDGFNRCLAAGHPFERCLREHTRPGSLRACSMQRSCREDFICAQFAGGDAQERGGACIPPYFLFQMRVDGHP